MVAVRASAAVVAAFLEVFQSDANQAKAFIANLNSPTQTVISVSIQSSGSLLDELQKAGFECRELDVPQPYHSPMLSTVASSMRAFAREKEMRFLPPQVSFCSSVDATHFDIGVKASDELRRAACEQVVHPVDFAAQIESLHEAGVRHFVEIGPATLLKTLVPAILGSRAHKVSTAAAILPHYTQNTAMPAAKVTGGGRDKTADATKGVDSPDAAPSPVDEQRRSQYAALIREAVCRVAGYKDKTFAFGDRFLEDLNIDSIKKAEIVFSVIAALNLEQTPDFRLSFFERLDDLLDYCVRASTSLSAATAETIPIRKTEFERFEISWLAKPLDTPKITPEITPPITAAGVASDVNQAAESHNPIFVDLQSVWSPIKGQEPPPVRAPNPTQSLALIGASSTSITLPAVASDCARGVAFASFVQRLIGNGGALGLRHIALCTSASPSPVEMGVAAMLRSVAKEHPALFVKHIMVNDSQLEHREELQRIIAAEMSEPSDLVVNHSGKSRSVAQLAPLVTTLQDNAAAMTLGDDSVIVAIGGATGITLSVLQGIIRRLRDEARSQSTTTETAANNIPRVVIAGRSAPSEPHVARALRVLLDLASLRGDEVLSLSNGSDLWSRASTARLLYVQLDASDKSAANDALARICDAWGAVDVVLNGVGVERSQALANRELSGIETELRNNVTVAHNLELCSRAAGVKKLIHFSSIVSLTGNHGQSVYAFAKSWINRTATLLSAADDSSTFSTSIAWPPWDGVGMTSSDVVLGELRAAGVSLLGAARADELFAEDLRAPCGAHDSTVAYFDLRDRPVYRLGAIDSWRYRGLLGLPGPVPGGLVFRRELSLKTDPYIDDHRIQGVPYLPAATELAMSLCAGRLFFGSQATLSDCAVESPVVVHNRPLGTELTIAFAEGTVGSDPNPTATISFSAQVSAFSCLATAAARGADEEAPALVLDQAIAKELDHGAFYHQGRFFHGPMFQCMQRAALLQDGNTRVWLHNRALREMFRISDSGDAGIYAPMIQWLDTAFQTLGLVAAFADQGLCIPVRIGAILQALPQQIPDELIIQTGDVQVIESGDGGVRGDVSICLPSGEVIVGLRAVELHSVKSSRRV